jgi:uroporphyrinogen III methyltransferase / synthase
LENKPLQARGVVVTRPAAQAAALASLLENAGGRAILFPAIDIEPVTDQPLPALAGFDLAIFISPTAVQYGFEAGRWPRDLPVAAVGKGTRRALEQQGVANVVSPESAADSEALLALPALQEVAGKKILIVRGEGGREVLGEKLAERGAQVDYAQCYRRLPPKSDPAPLLAAWDQGRVDAVTVYSAEAFDHLRPIAGERLLRTPLFATHERIAEHARQAGVQQVRVAGPGDDEMLTALMAYFAPPVGSPMAETPPARKSRAPLLLLLAIVLATALSGAFWLDARQRLSATQDELARRLRDMEVDSREARAVARQAQEAQRESQAKVGQLEARLAESQSQQLALEALYQELSRNRDEWQLAEIEQVLAIASQQLQLAGNVRAALLALQLAEARLARTDRPQFLPVRRALARDIERLKALPALDLPGMTMRLDTLVAQVDALPLAFDERGERIGAPKEPAPPPERGFWARLGAEVWSELRQLVVVRQVNNPEPPLLPPSQAYFLRENLRLRLLNARLTLLTRDEAGYREDLRVAQRWIQRYFDPRARQTVDALNQLKQLSSATISFEMPTISESLEAVRGFQSRRERTPQ